MTHSNSLGLDKSHETKGTLSKYWCFISYRHADNKDSGRQWATWLHHHIETYEVPADLVGTTNANGEIIPEQIFPVFRDEEELAADADLTASIYEALDSSRYLIVLCSPKAVQSKYVEDEIRYFKQNRNANRVLAVIIEGEPNVNANTDSTMQECFPESLRHPVDKDGNILTNGITEPIAADFRLKDGGQGWTSPEAYRQALLETGMPKGSALKKCVEDYRQKCDLVVLKIIAGILGISLGLLTERDKAYQLKKTEKRVKVFRRVAAAMGILFVVATGLGILAYFKQLEAVEQKEEVFTGLLASKSRVLLADDGADASFDSILLAVEAISRYSDIGKRSSAAERALREALKIRPRPLLSLDAKTIKNQSFTPDSSKFVVTTNSEISIFSTETSDLINTFNFEAKEEEVLWLNNDHIILKSKCCISIYDIQTGESILVRHNVEQITVSSRVTFVSWYDPSHLQIEVWFSEQPKKTSIIPVVGTLLSLSFSSAENHLAIERKDRSQEWFKISKDGKIGESIIPKVNTKMVEIHLDASSSDWKYVQTHDMGTHRISVLETTKGNTVLEFNLEGMHSTPECRFTIDDKSFLCWSESTGLLRWDTTTTPWKSVFELNYIDPIDSKASHITISPVGNVYLEGHFQTSVDILKNSSNGKEITSIHRSGIDFLEDLFSDDGRFLALSEPTRVRVFSTHYGLEVARYAFDDGVHPYGIKLSPNGKFLVLSEGTGSSDELIENQLRLFIIQPDLVQERNGELPNTCSTQHLNTQNGVDSLSHIKKTNTFDNIYKLNSSYLNEAVELYEDSEVLEVVNSITGKKVWEYSPDWVNEYQSLPYVSPNGEYWVLSGYYIGNSQIPGDGELHIWDTKTWNEHYTLEAPGVISPNFSNDDAFFTVMAHNEPLKVLQSNTLEEILSFKQGEFMIDGYPWRGELPPYRFSHDSKYLIFKSTFGSLDTGTKCTPLYPEEMLIDACSRITRNFNSEEWKTYFGQRPYKKICSGI